MTNMFTDLTHRRILNVLLGTLFCLMTTALPADLPREEPRETLVMGYQFGSPLPFVVEISSKGQIYQWSTLAIQVVSIECDGKNLPPFGSGVAIHSFDDTVIGANAERITYLASPSTLISVREYHKATGEYEADGYTIPPQFKQLVITYRGRFPGSEPERVYKLRIVPEPSP